MIRVSVFVLIAEQRGVLTRLDRIRIVGTLLSMWSGILYHPPPDIVTDEQRSNCFSQLNLAVNS